MEVTTRREDKQIKKETDKRQKQGVNNTPKEKIATPNPPNKPKEPTTTPHTTGEVAGSFNVAEAQETTGTTTMETRSPKYTNMRDEIHDHIKVIKVIKVTKITKKGLGSQTQTKDTSEAGTKKKHKDEG